ncbi:M4 family metallopeptidase [Pontimicrobium sp. MEBiC06410]
MMKKYNYLVFCAMLASGTLFAQNTQKSIADFQKKTQATITVNENFGTPEFVKFPLNNSLKVKGGTPYEKALNFLETNKSIYNIDASKNKLVLNKEETDTYGLKNVLVQQEYNGVPVYDGKLRFHFNAQERLTSVNGNYIPNIKLDATPTLSEGEANALAMEAIASQNINYSGTALFVNKSTLYVFAKGLAQGFLGSKYLVYEVEVRNDKDVREFVFVNAHNGTIVEQFTGMAHALDRVVYEGNTGNTVWEEGDAFPGSLTIWQQNEVVASGHTYYFFENAFGYTSYDGADAQMRTINNDPNISCPNANWNGATANYCNGTATDDVIAHEWGHAYTGSTSGLIYQWQSGALNESFSDIWGETVDILNAYEDADDDNSLRTGCGSSDRWMIGEDATAFGGAIRDMWDPTCRNHPGKVTDGQYWCSTGDSGGVHINSGIPNHAYALLVDGGNFNGQVVNGIGFTKAAHIFWRAQSQYLTATSDFASMADALEASATDLIGINLEGLSTTDVPAGPSGEMITAADVDAVIAAVLAVEMRINPDACGFDTILAPIPDLCDNATNDAIFFEDWETGMDGWLVEQAPINAATWEDRDWVVDNTLPKGRAGSAAFGTDPIIGDCAGDLENGKITLTSPEITIPNFTEGTYELAFNHYIATETDYDGGNIKYKLDGGAWQLLGSAAFTANPYNGALMLNGNDNPLRGEVAFHGADEGSLTSSWGTSVIDLSSLGVTANSTIQFRFELGTDGCNGRDGWYVDEVMLYNCQYSLSVAEFNGIANLVKVYPNPSNGIFNIEKTSTINLVKAEIHDINGRIIRTVDLSNMSTTKAIDLSGAASGMYFMTITSGNSKGVVKLIKQ